MKNIFLKKIKFLIKFQIKIKSYELKLKFFQINFKNLNFKSMLLYLVSY